MCQATGAWVRLHAAVADALARGMPPDEDSCMAVLGALKREGTPAAARVAVQVFTDLQREGVPLDGRVYGCMIALLSEHRMERLALKLESIMREADIELDTRLYNLLLRAASYVGGPSGADERRLHAFACFELYGRMLAEGRRPDLVTLNTLMRTISRQFDVLRCVSFLSEYRRRGFEPDERTYVTVIKACIRAADGRSALSILSLMRARGVHRGRVAYNAVLSALVEAEMYEEADGIYEEMRSYADSGREAPTDHVTETIMIRVYARLGKPDEALAQLAQHLRKEDAASTPRPSIFEDVMACMCRAGRPADAIAVFQTMIDAGTCPSREGLDILATLARENNFFADAAFEKLALALRRFRADISLKPFWTLIRSCCYRDAQGCYRAFRMYGLIVGGREEGEAGEAGRAAAAGAPPARGGPAAGTVAAMVRASLRLGTPGLIDGMLMSTAESAPEHVGVVLAVVVDKCAGDDAAPGATAVDIFCRMQDRFGFSFVVGGEDGEEAEGGGGGGPDPDPPSPADVRPRISLRLFTDLVRLCVQHDRPEDARRLLAAVDRPSAEVQRAYQSVASLARSAPR